MNFTILNGMHPGQQPIEVIHSQLERDLERSGHSYNSFRLHQTDMPWCRGDFFCWIKTPGECMLKGISSEIGQTMIRNDVTVFLTPVTFGGYSSQLKKALDHQIGLILPHFMNVGGETHHKPRYERYPRLAGIGFLNEPDEEKEKIFSELIGRNAINMHAPAHAACFVYADDSPERISVKLTLLFGKTGVKL